MKRYKIKFITFFKNLILLLRPHLVFGFIQHLFLTISNTIQLSRWISVQSKNKLLINDFFDWKRDHYKRYGLYQSVLNILNEEKAAFNYLEFGVCRGESFKWWLENTKNSEHLMVGFDTFEGLPENWGVFKKGDMNAEIPLIEDLRGRFVKGLFQDTLPSFLKEGHLTNDKKLIVHLDADLFTSTLYVLTTLAPYLKKGDILFFDEFNVPNHEFFAFKMFCDSYYIKTKLLGAVNNYYQVAIEIE